MSGDEHAQFDAAYVLGALSEQDQVAYEAHLAACPDCRANVAALREVTALLALASPDAFAADAEIEMPAADLLPGLLRKVRAQRTRRRWTVAAVSTLAAACLVLVTALIVRPRSTPAPPTHPIAMVAVTTTPIHATADLTDVAWGTKIVLHCTYDPATSYPAGDSYMLVVTSKNGATQMLGTWSVTPGQAANYPSGTSLPRSDIATIAITTTSGTPVLELHL